MPPYPQLKKMGGRTTPQMPKIYKDLPRRRIINTLESVTKNVPFFYGVAAKLQLREAARQMATLAAATSRYGAGNPKIGPKILSITFPSIDSFYWSS